jgi:dihydrolipoamide dehydrogenase
MFDIIVIGGGPTGVTAALRARELGASVALVERNRMGGTCTNDGCVPTRVLAHAARLIRDAAQFETYGLLGPQPQLDFARLMRQTRHIVETIHDKKELVEHLQQAGVSFYHSEARFTGEHTIALSDGTELEGDKFIIAVGGHARRLPFPGSEHALTHSDVWEMQALPHSVAIVGAAATGCQLASVFHDFGAQVTLLEVMPRILSGEDEHVSATMTEALTRRGIRIVTGMGGIEGIEQQGGDLRVTYTLDDEQQTLTTEAVILAVCWPGNVEALNLEAASVETEKSYIKVNDSLQTTAPHIFAAGDITGRMMLVQSGSYEARVAAENAVLGTSRDYEHRIVPHGGFTEPEYGSVGLTEQQAREAHNVTVALVPYAHLDRAVIDGRTEGFCKLVVDRDSHLILGAHVVGEQAVEVVQMVAAGMAAGMRIEQLAELELAYPTFTAIVGLAARQLARELGVIPLAREWSNLRQLNVAEWERSG